MQNLLLCDLLLNLHDIILAERRAAKALLVDEMLELTGKKEQALKEILPMVEVGEALNPREKALAEAVYTENLRNAYFFWSALKWVRESMAFMGRSVQPLSYEENGNMSKGRYSGALISGKI